LYFVYLFKVLCDISFIENRKSPVLCFTLYTLTESDNYLFFFSALDLQDCAISTNGAKEFLNSAKFNSLIHIIDIRNNPLVDRDVMEKLIEQLLVNCEDDRLCEVCISFKIIFLKIFICI